MHKTNIIFVCTTSVQWCMCEEKSAVIVGMIQCIEKALSLQNDSEQVIKTFTK